MPSGVYKHKPFSKETKLKMSKARIGKYCGKNHPMYGIHRFGKNSPNWKGGRNTSNGYMTIICRNHPHPKSGVYVYEHRLVMEKHLGRYLTPEEIVHHINGNKLDNRIENLMLFASKSEHVKFHNTP